LLVSRLEGKRGVDEIEIEVVELEFLETGLEGGFDAFRTMIVFQSFVATNTSSRLIFPALNTSCIASPTSFSFR
jgi:hypothetical protein